MREVQIKPKLALCIYTIIAKIKKIENKRCLSMKLLDLPSASGNIRWCSHFATWKYKDQSHTSSLIKEAWDKAVHTLWFHLCCVQNKYNEFVAFSSEERVGWLGGDMEGTFRTQVMFTLLIWLVCKWVCSLLSS